MRYVKWAIWILIALLIGGFLFYTLPRHEVVRILDAYEKRVDLGSNSIFYAQPDSGEAVADGRDVRFIDTIRENGKQLVFRNEDTSWDWPPYFKFNSADLNAQAKDLISTKEDPQWVLMRYYGWRSNFLSIYPNATSLKPVPTADYTVIPWFNIVFLTILAWLVWRIWRWWDRVYEEKIEPRFDSIRYKIRGTGD